MSRLLALVAALAAGGGLVAQPASQADRGPQGEPRSGQVLRDPEFGVTARHFGLERRVEMYQWLRHGHGYVRGWRTEPVDSSTFEPGHANPPLPLRSRRWIAADVTLDGHPIAPETLASVGQWRVFRPNFSRLPGNLLATFQPEGDGLGTADNPLAPEIGDLRITWRELVLPPLQDRLVLRAGQWVAAEAPAGPAPAAPPDTHADSRRRGWLPALTGLLAAALALGLWRRRRRG